LSDEQKHFNSSSPGSDVRRFLQTIIRKGKPMKTLSFALFLMASLAFVLSGCSDRSAPVVGPADQAISASTVSSSLAKGGILNSVTGSCQSYQVVVEDPILGTLIIPGQKSKESFYNTITFSAIEQNDGTYSGNFVSQFHNVPKDQATGGLAKVTGRVLHVSVQDNMGKIVFQIVDGDYTGMWGVIVVKDLGEGGKSGSLDLQSAWLISDIPGDLQLWKSQTPQEYINMTVEMYQPYLPWFNGWLPIDNGNVQVR
jgi:hypothetical protein